MLSGIAKVTHSHTGLDSALTIGQQIALEICTLIGHQVAVKSNADARVESERQKESESAKGRGCFLQKAQNFKGRQETVCLHGMH